MAAAAAAGGVDDVSALLARRDVFRDHYDVAPTWPGVVPLERHAGAQYELWRRDPRDGGVRHAQRVVAPYYAVQLPPELLTARDTVNRRVRERAVVFARWLAGVRGADGTPLRVSALRAGFAAHVDFFGESARVDTRTLRTGVRVGGRYVNTQHLPADPPPNDVSAAAEAERERVRTIQAVRALNRALNRALVGYDGVDDARNAARWRNVRAADQARTVWPSLSQRAFWSEAGWRRALALTAANGGWTRRWEGVRRDVRTAAVAAQR